MAEALKNQFALPAVKNIAEMIGNVDKNFDAEGFVCHVQKDFEPLSLTERGWKTAETFPVFLYSDYLKTLGVLMKSLGKENQSTESFGMSVFKYMPHVFYVAKFGLEHFEASMTAQYELTKRFTAEFSIRPFIEKYPEATMERLSLWAEDSNPHVRRLVSEGTRPRLPWAGRLKAFQKDPSPVLSLLEKLKDDSEEYVRRSVANNLNDISKDHPALVIQVAKTWLRNTDANRRRLIKHALRTLIKKGNKEAIGLMGYSNEDLPEISKVEFQPSVLKIGDKVNFKFTLKNSSKKPAKYLVDFQVHYVKSSGKSSPKVFKLQSREFEPGQEISFQKQISLDDKTTRKHYPGKHSVDLLVNGSVIPLGTFVLNPR